MKASYRTPLRAAILSISFLAVGLTAFAQSGTSVIGTVMDPRARYSNATVEIHKPSKPF